AGTGAEKAPMNESKAPANNGAPTGASPEPAPSEGQAPPAEGNGASAPGANQNSPQSALPSSPGEESASTGPDFGETSGSKSAQSGAVRPEVNGEVTQNAPAANAAGEAPSSEVSDAPDEMNPQNGQTETEPVSGKTQSPFARTRAFAEGLKRLGFDSAGRRALFDAARNNEPVAVIGRGMARVNRIAESLREFGVNAKTYKPRNFRSANGVLDIRDLKANGSWIRYWAKMKGATFVDIGRLPEQIEPSPFYNLERHSLYDNWKYDKVIQPAPGSNP
ncbi:MAG: hypothetical protein ACREDR_17395, partial [Blastocatellia bacterium]